MEEKKARWEGKVSATLAKARADQIWPFFKDFFNIHKWFTGVLCYGIDGVNGEVGCIRFCSLSEDVKVNWAKEKLILIDHIGRSITYEIVETNMGFKSYVGMVKINPSTEGESEGDGDGDGDGDGPDGCVIEWSFATDPIEGSRLEDMVPMYQVWLNLLAKNMEEDALASPLESREAGNPKWEGKASAKVKGTPEQIWPFFEDFCSVHKWSPGIETSYKVEGVDGQPGLIRYCGFASPDGNQTEPKFTHEKLLMIDPTQRTFSYEITDNNVGFKGYVATWKVIPIEDGDDEHGCQIEWGFIADPIDGWKFEDFFGFVQLGLNGAAESMGKALQSIS